MKKKLLVFPLLLISLFFGTTIVNADDNVFHFNNYYRDFDLLPDVVSDYSSEIDQLISNFSSSSVGSTYDYYYIAYLHHTTALEQDWLVLFPTSDNIVYVSYDILRFNRIMNSHSVELWFRYNITTDTFDNNLNFDKGNMAIWASPPILTNFDYVFSDEQYDKLVLPSYSDNTFDIPSYELYENDIIPTYETLSNNSYNTYIEIDLNSYDYVILSLKNYSSPSFMTNIYTLGKLCFTPVYNYGMTEKKDIYPSYKTQSCTGLFDTYTAVNISISDTDIFNHSVFYIKSYNSSAVNKIRVNSSKFDITYITSQNASDPQVEINGRSYPVIPFDQLTDTANISTSEGYISGQVCALGDINCEYENGIGLDISDIFTQPLTILQSVWASITSVFALISEFILLIPSPLREFLIASFMLAIILGILKIIL